MSTSVVESMGGRVALVGTGSRAAMFIRGILARPTSSVVALCEPNAVRAAYYNELLVSLGAPSVPVYKPTDFKKMLKDENVQVLVVTCVDALHDLYIIPALEAGGEGREFHRTTQRSLVVQSAF
jgi:predicted dehydrogenase